MSIKMTNDKLSHGFRSISRNLLWLSLSFFFYHLSLGLATAQTQKGIASYYSKNATGARTASGQPLHHDSMTCAHRTFPFGTYLRVTNPASDRSVIVRVNDRGPYLHGRIIDLSWGAARKLGILSQGIASVIVERIGSAVIPLKDTSQVILPELGLATLASYQDAVPEWQDTVNINHRRLNRKMEQTVRNSWIDMILNRLRKK